METVMMALGAFRFSISSAAYQALERQTEYRWAQVERIGRKPAQQFVGEGADTIRLSGTIFPGFIAQRAGLEQLPAMRAQAGLGVPLLLVSGAGRVLGEFCITSVNETQTVFFSDGTPRRIDFDLSLVAYG
jgi:hypothetical protein